MLHLLSGKHQNFSNWPQHQVLLGHAGRVNCLLYPNNEHPRYDVAHLVSGSVDFSVCLWDIYTGTLLHRFCSHSGEITNLYVRKSEKTQFFFRKSHFFGTIFENLENLDVSKITICNNLNFLKISIFFCKSQFFENLNFIYFFFVNLNFLKITIF